MVAGLQDGCLLPILCQSYSVVTHSGTASAPLAGVMDIVSMRTASGSRLLLKPCGAGTVAGPAGIHNDCPSGPAV